MELLTITIAIFTLAEKVLSLKDKINQTKEKEALAVWLTSTGDLLSSVARGLRLEVYPYEKCAQLQYTLTHMNNVLGDYMDEAQLNELMQLANEAYQVERLFGEMRNMSLDEREANIRKIEEAVGKYYAAANFITVE